MSKLLITSVFAFILTNSLAREFDSLGFKNDLKIFRKALEETHPDLYRFTSKEKFRITFDSIDRQITNKTSLLEYFRLLSKIEALVRESHTYLQLPKSLLLQLRQQKLLPFHVVLNEKTLAITKSIDENYEVYEGSEIESINGKSCTEIIHKMEGSAGLKSGFNNSTLSNILSFDNNFASAYYLLVDTSTIFTIKFKGIDNTINILGVDDQTKEPFPKFAKELSPPIHLQIDAANETAILKITTFAYWMVSSSKREYIKSFSNYFDKIKKAEVKNLIIDVRNNRGGEELLAAELLTYLINSEFKIYTYMKAKTLSFNYGVPNATNLQFAGRDYLKTDSGYFKIKDEVLATFSPKKENHFTGKVFMLSSGGSRSAASTFLSLAHTYKAGIIIGEESGGVYEDVDGRIRINLTLPSSGVQLSFPAWSFKINSRNGNRYRGVIPDFIVQPNHANSAATRDAELELAYKLTLLCHNNVTDIEGDSYLSAVKKRSGSRSDTERTSPAKNVKHKTNMIRKLHWQKAFGAVLYPL